MSVKTQAADTIKDLFVETDEEVPPDILKQTDLSVPDEYELEIQAAKLIEHLAAYNIILVEQRVARQAGRGDIAEQKGKDLLFHRTSVAYIQWKWPKARAIAEMAMREQARRTRDNRAKISE